MRAEGSLKRNEFANSAKNNNNDFTRGPQLVVCAYEISKFDEYNESRDTEYTRIYCSLYRNC